MGFQGGQGGYDRGPREMHKAICADCKKECEVPFKPSGNRPVYCKECFSKRKANNTAFNKTDNPSPKPVEIKPTPAPIISKPIVEDTPKASKSTPKKTKPSPKKKKK